MNIKFLTGTAFVIGIFAVATPAHAVDLVPDSGSINGGESVEVIAPASKVTLTQIEVGMGGDFSLAFGDDGRAYSWGDNYAGQLGNGTYYENRNTPGKIAMPEGVTSFTQVSAGHSFVLALGDNGKTYSWGENYSGQLGDGTNTSRNTPGEVTLPEGVTSFTQVSAGGSSAFALGNNGKTYSWGDNYYGQLGNGKTSPIGQSVPGEVLMPSGVSSFTSVSAGIFFTMALGDNGKTYSWGGNYSGELGDPTAPSTGRSVPGEISMPAGGASFTSVSAGGSHTVALGDDGKTYSWGSNDSGQLGNGTNTNRDLPGEVILPAGVTNFVQVDTGNSHVLALGNDGKAYAWGASWAGQLGDGTNTNRDLPREVPMPAGVTSFTQLAAGDSHSVALADDGNAYSWGSNNSVMSPEAGQLGDGTFENQSLPVPVVPLVSTVTVTSVSFGDVPGTGLTDNGDGTWAVTAPAQKVCGPVDLTLSYTRDGVEQPPLIEANGYTYTGAPKLSAPTDVTVKEGSTATLTTTVSVCPATTVTWEQSSNQGADWEPVNSAPGLQSKSAGLSLKVVGTPANNGYQYRPVAAYDGGRVIGKAATLSVETDKAVGPGTGSGTDQGTSNGSDADPSLEGGSLASTGGTILPAAVFVSIALLLVAGAALFMQRRGTVRRAHQ